MAEISNTPLPLPSQEVLLSILDLDRSSGRLFWKIRPVSMFGGDAVRCQQFNTRRAGKEALASVAHGYKRGSLFGNFVFAHRVVWKMAYGEDPEGQIDHINGVRSDNRLENLRVVDDAANRKNASRPRDNTSGHIGVRWHKAAGKWAAEITVKRVRYFLGVFDNLSEAVSARKLAEDRFEFHVNHGKTNPYQGE